MANSKVINDLIDDVIALSKRVTELELQLSMSDSVLIGSIIDREGMEQEVEKFLQGWKNKV